MSNRPSRRILFIGLNYSPEPIGVGPYSSGLAEALVERGHQVAAVVGQPYYPEWRLYERYKGRWKSSVEQGVRITRCPHYVPANPTGSRRIAHHLSFASSAYPAARIIRRDFSPDLVVTVAPSMVAVPVAARMARRAGIPLWLHVQDFEVGAAMATGLIEQGSATAMAAARFEKRMLRSADVVSTISGPMCALAMEKGVAPDRVIEIRNWANHGDRIAGSDGAALRERWGLTGQTVALYSGNIANKQGLEIVVEAAHLLSHRPDITFVICGEGPNRRHLEALARGAGNIRFYDLQAEEMIGELLKMADVHLLPQTPDAADLVLPSKIGNMLASGRPIVATAGKNTGIARELDGAGVIVPPRDAQAFAWSVEQLSRDPDLRARMGRVGRERAARSWSRAAIVEQFDARMQLLLENR
ncbi:WcaI family glycosyltransferase [Qipengyuania sp. XHP0207]|uniref:WcaI family glycosyltransferase n=1 Tax=Qipengyuania sp. XHP0207 TaxID=3038078 RepID=UPI00241C9DBA|nr:WcaI family glycosyltransferase [Qipengyuania sp. XHP0207]MDG5747847.1 WcaI family glycosyltransferase [Qipengyuania sp. XHP0207]